MSTYLMPEDQTPDDIAAMVSDLDLTAEDCDALGITPPKPKGQAHAHDAAQGREPE